MWNRAWWTELCAAIDRKDTAAFLAYLAPDGEFRFANGPPATGHAAIGAAVDGFWASIRGSRHEIESTWSDAASTVCEGWVTYTRHDGSTLRLPFVDVLHMRDGRAARYYIYMDATPLWK